VEGWGPVAAGSSFVTSISEVQRVRLSRSNCYHQHVHTDGGLVYHDQSTIFVRLFTQCIQFCNCVVKGLFGEMTRSIGGVQNLVVKHREIESETQADLTKCQYMVGIVGTGVPEGGRIGGEVPDVWVGVL